MNYVEYPTLIQKAIDLGYIGIDFERDVTTKYLTIFIVALSDCYSVLDFRVNSHMHPNYTAAEIWYNLFLHLKWLLENPKITKYVVDFKEDSKFLPIGITCSNVIDITESYLNHFKPGLRNLAILNGINVEKKKKIRSYKELVDLDPFNNPTYILNEAIAIGGLAKICNEGKIKYYEEFDEKVHVEQIITILDAKYSNLHVADAKDIKKYAYGCCGKIFSKLNHIHHDLMIEKCVEIVKSRKVNSEKSEKDVEKNTK